MSDALFSIVENLNLPVGDFAIFGSGPLIVRGIVECTNDLDIICRGAAWQAVQEQGNAEFIPEYAASIVSIASGAITFGTEWSIGDFDTDSLIDNAEIIKGLPFVRAEYVMEYKRIRRSEKDLAHISAAIASGL